MEQFLSNVRYTLLEQERAVSAVLAENTKASDRDLIQCSDMVITDVLKPLAIATK